MKVMMMMNAYRPLAVLTLGSTPLIEEVLLNVNNDFYQFVKAIELEMKGLLQVPQTHIQCHIGNPKDFATTLSQKSNIIELWRSILPAEATPTEELKEELLLHCILTLYATVRVHAFATKIVKRKCIQKSKNMRKRLIQ